jgi:hypothetical protein
MKDAMHADYRLFITALPHPEFPLGLLQMSTKVTNEPPAGMRMSGKGGGRRQGGVPMRAGARRRPGATMQTYPFG